MDLFFDDEKKDIKDVFSKIRLEKNNFDKNYTIYNKFLEQKINIPYDSVLNDIPNLNLNIISLNDCIKKLNIIIEKHNKKVKNFNKEMQEAQKKIKEHLLKINHEEVIYLKLNIKNIQSQINNETSLINNEIKEKQKEIIQKEDRIKTIENPIDYFNNNLSSFLGRDDIKLQYSNQDGSYTLLRDESKISEHISEGERTAICLLHFLFSLKNNSREEINQKNIVVIDDPVSSLDSNYLYNAYSFIRSELKDKDIEQLFIITHHFYFFKIVQNWFEKKQKKQHKIMQIVRSSEKFESTIENIDSYLKNYSSEYQYIFSKLQLLKNKIDNQEALSYDDIMSLPNNCRRVFEAIVSFLEPFEKYTKACNKIDQIVEDASGIDPNIEKYLNYIYRYTNTESHMQLFDFVDHYNRNPEEAKVIIKTIINFIDIYMPHHIKAYELNRSSYLTQKSI